MKIWQDSIFIQFQWLETQKYIIESIMTKKLCVALHNQNWWSANKIHLNWRKKIIHGTRLTVMNHIQLHFVPKKYLPPLKFWLNFAKSFTLFCSVFNVIFYKTTMLISICVATSTLSCQGRAGLTFDFVGGRGGGERKRGPINRFPEFVTPFVAFHNTKGGCRSGFFELILFSLWKFVCCAHMLTSCKSRKTPRRDAKA